jgi:hypothetical protein
MVEVNKNRDDVITHQKQQQHTEEEMADYMKITVAKLQNPKIADYSTTSLLKGIALPSRYDGLMLLSEDHSRIYSMYKGQFKWIDYNNSMRRDIANQIILLIRLHHALESTLLQPIMEPTLRQENSESHDQILKDIEVISSIETEDYVPYVDTLMEHFINHAEREESDVFPKLREKMNRYQLEILYSLIRDIRQLNPNLCKTLCLLDLEGPIRKSVKAFLKTFPNYKPDKITKNRL